MFTGIIEHLGTIESLEISPAGGRVAIHAPTLLPSLAVSKSVAVNGCCLTVVALGKESFSADLSGETIQKTSFGATSGQLKRGSHVNLEQPLTAGKEFGGHFVQGHVDTTGRVQSLEPESANSGNWRYTVEVPEDFARYIVPKGSITIDGISLTVAAWNPQTRTVEIAVIPYTYQHTNIRHRAPGDAVNLEADVLGKYVERFLEARNAAPQSKITRGLLSEQGFDPVVSLVPKL
ncbi:MAG TPA: riboflavin synthase [Candidatus Acidoferrum sp.]|nr:riboflavin synthase [Candidatus Acidoferrum sp.]